MTCGWSSCGTAGPPTRWTRDSGSAPWRSTATTTSSIPDLGRGGSFYLTVNGRDFLVRGAAYTPDLLFSVRPPTRGRHPRIRAGPRAEHAASGGKFPGDNIIERADELGIPLMYGWMCCNQWEKWWQWDDEDRRVADESMRSQILSLRGHASAFLWANGSDGKPPAPVLEGYHGILRDLHWPNTVVDTVSSLARDRQRGT